MNDDLQHILDAHAKAAHSSGLQDMQIAVLKWANSHKDTLKRAGLVDSLLDAMAKARK